jgi:hypothetical protein
MDPSGPSIEQVRILSGLIRVSTGDDRMQFTVVHPPSPTTFFVTLLQCL